MLLQAPIFRWRATAGYHRTKKAEERLLTEIQLDGRVFCSNAVLNGRFVLRICIVNFRTEAEDLDALLDVASELGARVDAELRPAQLKDGAA